MPVVSDVRLNEVYGWPDTRTGTLDPGGSPPAAPVITNVVDDGNQDSATVSVTGTGTIQLYYRQQGLSAWTTGESRSGNGDIVQDGLIAGTWYEMYATAISGGTSAPSNLVTIYLATEPGTGTLKQAIYAILMGDSALQGLVDGRVTPGGDPQKGDTSVVFYQISSIPGHSFDGPDTYINETLQVNSYGMRDYTAESVANAVRNALNGFSGTVNGVSIQYAALQDQGDIDDFEPGNRKVSRHGVRQDYLISYQQL